MNYVLPEHIRFSREKGFIGITAKDKEQWMRKHPYVEDFDLTVEEAQGWLSQHWNQAFTASQAPRVFLDQWLGCEWLKLNTERYKEPETIYNPEQLSSFIEQYFKNTDLIRTLTRGKRDGYTDVLATEHYEKALGHAVKLRTEVSDFTRIPEAKGKSHLDLRRLQEWCIDCEKIIDDLLAGIDLDCLEKVLSCLRELKELLETGYPPIDEMKWGKIYDKVRGELETLNKVMGESGNPNLYQHDTWIFVHDFEPLLTKLAEHKIHVPHDKEELREMITAAQLLAKVDWDKVKAIVEEQKSRNVRGNLLDEIREHSMLLAEAQTAEEKIKALVWRTYCRENRDFAEAIKQTQERIQSLFNEAAEVLNAEKAIHNIAYLRDDKLASAFKRLNDHLFGTPILRGTDDDHLHEIIEEIETIQNDAVKRNVNMNPPTEVEEKVEFVEKLAEREQDTETHSDFLVRIANTIHDELAQKHSNRECFQEQLRGFRKLKDDFARALKEAQQAALGDPALRYDYDNVKDKDKAPPEPPREGYVVERHYALTTPPKGFWRPPLPFNPDGWLQRFECPWIGLVHPPAEEPRDKTQMLMCEYALLATIHDAALDIPICDRLTDSDLDDWAESLWIGVRQKGAFPQDIATLPLRQTYIRTSLTNVRNDVELRAMQKQKMGREMGETQVDSDNSTIRHNKNDTKVLREIADKLFIWRESVPGDERDLQRFVKLPKEKKETACEALRLLRDNIKLLLQCKHSFGALNSECEEALLQLNGILTDPDASKNIERYWGWGYTFATTGFINELKRWADEIKRSEGENQQNMDSLAYVKRGDTKKNGKMWEFGFGGETHALVYYAGFEVMTLLLDQPDKELLRFEINANLAKLARGDDYHEGISPQEIYGKADRKSIEEGIAMLETRRGDESDPEERDEYQKKIDECRKLLNNSTKKRKKGQGPQSRTFSSARAMSKNHDTAMDYIKHNFPLLYNHLNAFMYIGEISYYKPDHNIHWNIS